MHRSFSPNSKLGSSVEIWHPKCLEILGPEDVSRYASASTSIHWRHEYFVSTRSLGMSPTASLTHMPFYRRSQENAKTRLAAPAIGYHGFASRKKRINARRNSSRIYLRQEDEETTRVGTLTPSYSFRFVFIDRPYAHYPLLQSSPSPIPSFGKSSLIHERCPSVHQPSP